MPVTGGAAYGCGVSNRALLARPLVGTSTERTRSAALAVGSLGACAVLALVDPETSGRYPVCPTRAALGIDCPACGTLRGLHALSRGHLGQALDHNVLLLVAVPIGLLLWWQWVRTAVGRPARRSEIPDWVVPATVAVAAIFMIVRNLPIHGLRWLDSA